MDQIRSPNRHFRKDSPFNGQLASLIIAKYEQSKSIKEVQRAFRTEFYSKSPWRKNVAAIQLPRDGRMSRLSAWKILWQNHVPPDNSPLAPVFSGLVAFRFFFLVSSYGKYYQLWTMQSIWAQDYCGRVPTTWARKIFGKWFAIPSNEQSCAEIILEDILSIRWR